MKKISRVVVAFATLISLSLPVVAQDKVVFRSLSSHGSVSAHELAQELGYFDKTNVEIKNVGYAGGGPESLFALASGSVDIGGAATPAVINAVASGNAFLVAYPENGINKQTQSLFTVLEGSPIRSIKDIAGKTIAVNTLGAHLDYTVREALRSVGLPPDAANLVVVPGPQLEQVLRSGQVDIAAFGYWQTTFEGAARSHGGLRSVFGDTDVLGNIAGGFTVLREDFVQRHPQAAKQFTLQSAKALDFARENPEETKNAIARILKKRGENPDIAQYFAGYGVRAGGLPDKQDLQFWIDVLTREGRVKPESIDAQSLILSLN